MQHYIYRDQLVFSASCNWGNLLCTLLLALAFSFLFCPSPECHSLNTGNLTGKKKNTNKHNLLSESPVWFWNEMYERYHCRQSVTWQLTSSGVLLQEAIWHASCVKRKLRAAEASQVVVGGTPKSAEKVDLLTIFQPRHACRKVIGRKSGALPVLFFHIFIVQQNICTSESLQRNDRGYL